MQFNPRPSAIKVRVLCKQSGKAVTSPVYRSNKHPFGCLCFCLLVYKGKQKRLNFLRLAQNRGWFKSYFTKNTIPVRMYSSGDCSFKNRTFGSPSTCLLSLCYSVAGKALPLSSTSTAFSTVGSSRLMYFTCSSIPNN